MGEGSAGGVHIRHGALKLWLPAWSAAGGDSDDSPGALGHE